MIIKCFYKKKLRLAVTEATDLSQEPD